MLVGDDAAPEWWFYHLSRTSLELAIAPLMQKCLDRGWRALIVSPHARRRADLDRILWTWADASFLPHGDAEAAGLDPSRQPVLISETCENENNADVIVLLDGTSMPAGAPCRRCMVVFDGADRATRAVARDQYKSAGSSGCKVRYFQQSPKGGWQEANTQQAQG